MTEDRARKKAIRARMAASGEPYSVAARNLAAGRPVGNPDAATEITACAVRTLEAPGARIAFHSDWNFPPRAEFSSAVRLISSAVEALWKRVAPGQDLSHGTAEGFAEPATGRYMIDFGGWAEIRIAGTTYTGQSGRSLDALRPRGAHTESGDVLWLLRVLPGATEASTEGTGTLRHTVCRKFAVQVDTAQAAAASKVRLRVPRGVDPGQEQSLALTVWVDDQHVRQVRFTDQGQKDITPGQPGSGISKDVTLELWDFGVPTGNLDWSSLPRFQVPG